MGLAVFERKAFIQEKAILKFHLSQRTFSAIYSNTKKKENHSLLSKMFSLHPLEASKEN